MITEFWQLMSCQNSTKIEIPRDSAAPRERALLDGLRAALAGRTAPGESLGDPVKALPG